MKLGIIFNVMTAVFAGEDTDSKLHRSTRQFQRQRFRGYQTYNNYYNPRFSQPRRPYSQQPQFPMQRQYQQFNRPRYPAQQHPYQREFHYQQPAYQQQLYEPIRPAENVFKEGVPLAKPGHLAIKAGRNVRPPGERDEREMNPRHRGFEPSHRLNNYEESTEYDYDYSEPYSSENGEFDSSYTSPDSTSIPATFATNPIIEGNSATENSEQQNSTQFEYLNSQCGPEGIAQTHLECKENRPWHPKNPDSEGLPDLITDAKRVEATVNLQMAQLKDLTCALEEGCLSQSAYNHNSTISNENRRLLRFTQKVSNIGDADFLSPTNPSEWEYHSCHKHYHSMNVFVKYSLLQGSEIVAASVKSSFCLEDSECRAGTSKKYHCLKEQAISPGCADVYVSGVDCQWIDVTDVSSGSYVLQVEVNPERAVEEKNYKNNIMECDLILNSREVRARNCRNNA